MKKFIIVLLASLFCSCGFFVDDRPEVNWEEYRELCPLKINSISWDRPFYYDRIQVSVANDSEVDIDRFYIYCSCEYLLSSTVGENWLNASTDLYYDLGMTAGDSGTYEWLLDRTETLSLNEEESYVTDIWFSDGTEWHDYDYYIY